MKFIGYIQELIKQGKCSFTLEHAQEILQKSRKAILASIGHLLEKKEVAHVTKSFYVIVPPEYQSLGCLPAEYFIPYLMKYLNLRYYACLLTAATYHGASHQAVQVFQVMVEKPRRTIVCGKIKINFIGNHKLIETPIRTITNAKCVFNVSTPEGTSMDLVKYPDQSGGFSHVATVMAELCDAINPDKLLKLLNNKKLETTWKQRLGYLLEAVGEEELASLVKTYLEGQKRVDYVHMQFVSASAEKNTRNNNYSKNNKWKIIENIKIESDL